MSADVEQLVATLQAAKTKALAEFSSVDSIDALEEFDRAFLGKKSDYKTAGDAIKTIPGPDRPALGQALGAYRAELTALVAERREAIEAAAAASPSAKIDLTLPPPGMPRGHQHLLTQIYNELTGIFIGLGYNVAEGPEVESDWFNFEALNFPPGHPARDMHDTLFVERGKPGSTLLRTQTSNVQVRTMLGQEPPVYVVAPGRVYRQETTDARHSPIFHQIEGLAVDRGITLGDMFGTITTFIEAYFGKALKTRFQPAYFPFTEPSCEFFCECVFCDGLGCRVCSKTGWVEIGGCGMVDPNVFGNVNYDPEEFTGFAFGFGLERMAMLRYDIDSIGSFYTNDARFLRQF